MKAEPQGEYRYDLGAVQQAQGEGLTACRRRERETKFNASDQLVPRGAEARLEDVPRPLPHGRAVREARSAEKADTACRKTIEDQAQLQPAFVCSATPRIDNGFPLNVAMGGARYRRADQRQVRAWWNAPRPCSLRARADEGGASALPEGRGHRPGRRRRVYGLGMAYRPGLSRRKPKENARLFLANGDARPDRRQAARDTVACAGRHLGPDRRLPSQVPGPYDGDVLATRPRPTRPPGRTPPSLPRGSRRGGPPSRARWAYWPACVESFWTR